MTDFVLHQQNQYWNGEEFEYGDTCVKSIIYYAKFLKQPLKLEMFVTCDEYGNVLEEPKFKDTLNSDAHFLATEKYKQAKEKVLFEGFEIATNKEGEKVILGDYTCLKVSDLEKMNIELLTKYTTINLTPNAIKQLGL
jgi:hypothetical protein